jgi:hypothetical protein
MNKKTAAAAVFLVRAGKAHGADKEKEPSAILEIGGASEWSLQNGGASIGPSIAVEVEPIKEWLELEAGCSPLLKKGSSPEWSTDLLFKKPFTLSDKIEFMIGAGPAWTYTDRSNQFAAEFALDFMFWPWPDRKLGWFVEPTYSYSFSAAPLPGAGARAGVGCRPDHN